MIELKHINHGNWLECIELEVGEGQNQFVSPNIFSLAEAYVHSEANKLEAEKYYRCIPFAIYSDNKMIGFTMLTYEKENDFDNKPSYEIYRLMIAKNDQGKGFGKEVIKQLLDYIKTYPYGETDYVYASWHPDNKASERICLANGFMVVGEDEEDGAVISRLAIKFNSGRDKK